MLSKGKSAEVKKQFLIELLKYCGNSDLKEQMKNWDPPRFPINGETLKKNGVPGIFIILRGLAPWCCKSINLHFEGNFYKFSSFKLVREKD